VTGDPVTPGQKIRAARKAKRLTQKQVATHMGVGQRQPMRWEKDENGPDEPEKLAALLEIPVEAISPPADDPLAALPRLVAAELRRLGKELGQLADDVAEVARVQAEMLELLRQRATGGSAQGSAR
jgi:transcriptional regulator with XRE-family HTH domain